MNDGRLPALALLVSGLVAVVALVAHGRPLAGNAGHGGVSDSFWSYVLTTTIIFFALGALVLVAALLSVRMGWTTPQTSLTRGLVRTLISLFILGVVVAYLERHHHLQLRSNPVSGSNGGRVPGDKNAATGSGAHFVWLEAVIFFGLLAVAVAIAVKNSRKNRKSAPELGAEPDAIAVGLPEAVAESLDESLDDLRSDPDLRRAIVAAYARMEHALRGIGLPRRPAEAPLEYLERALLTLDTSGPSVRRLTDLFEWAKFSHHEPEPSMRDEAVEALEAVRDELRAPIKVLA